jgi:single-stranded-DNA-specific exonuclease
VEFKQYIENSAKAFNTIDKKQTIRIISHIDTDGICSAGILTKALIRDKKKFSVTFVNYITQDFIVKLSQESHKNFVFLDLGTSQLKNIKTYLKDKKVFVLDHHVTRAKRSENEEEQIYHANPSLFNINSSREISAAGITYLFAKELNKKNMDLAYLGVVGAISDLQEENGFKGLNEEILNEAVASKKIIVEKGLKFFTSGTKPLYKLFMKSLSLYIPGLSGNEDKIFDFLNSVGIEQRTNNRWTRISDLEREQTERLVKEVSRIKVGEKEIKESKDIYANTYRCLSINEEIKNLKQLSTLLNACGCLDRASLGLGLLLGDKKSFIRATYTLKEYNREIISTLNWLESNKKTRRTIEQNGHIILNAETSTNPKILGTATSMLAQNLNVAEGIYLVTLSRDRNKKTKISMRMTGNKQNKGLVKLLRKVIEPFEGECGGHSNSAGGVIDVKYEQQFIENAKNELSKKAIEEVIE